MIYDFLGKPRCIKSALRRAEAEQDNLRLSMYPSAVRYDTDKVQSSPVDPMPRYAEKMDELQTRIKRLWLQLNDAQDDIIDKMLKNKDKKKLKGLERQKGYNRYRGTIIGRISKLK